MRVNRTIAVVSVHKGLYDLQCSLLDVTACASSARRKIDIQGGQFSRASATSSLSRNMLTSFTLAGRTLPHHAYTYSAIFYIRRVQQLFFNVAPAIYQLHLRLKLPRQPAKSMH